MAQKQDRKLGCMFWIWFINRGLGAHTVLRWFPVISRPVARSLGQSFLLYRTAIHVFNCTISFVSEKHPSYYHYPAALQSGIIPGQVPTNWNTHSFLHVCIKKLWLVVTALAPWIVFITARRIPVLTRNIGHTPLTGLSSEDTLHMPFRKQTISTCLFRYCFSFNRVPFLECLPFSPYAEPESPTFALPTPRKNFTWLF